MVKEIKNVVTWLKNWFYDKTEVYSKSETYTKSEVNSALSNKLNSNLTTANKMLVTDNNGNVVLDDKPTFEAIKVVASLPTASASTMGALYIISENSKVNVYYTKNNNGAYSWQKMDTDILDELSIDWTDVQNKPSTFPPISHSHSATEVIDANAHSSISTSANATQGTINTAIDSRIHNLDSWIGGLSFHIDEKNVYFVSSLPILAQGEGDTTGLYVLKNGNGDFECYTWKAGRPDVLGDYGSWELQRTIREAVTSIELVPKGSDPNADAYNGVIRLYYGDEQ